MRPIRVVAAAQAERSLLDAAVAALGREFRTACRMLPQALDPGFAHHRERNQYHSTAIIESLVQMNGHEEVLLAITDVDLYIPILTFVFGEAQLGGTCAVVSYHRLRQDFYGLPADHALLADRLIKEAIHEVGHTFGLTHCDDYECVMAASHAVEWLDLKGRSLCDACRHDAGL